MKNTPKQRFLEKASRNIRAALLPHVIRRSLRMAFIVGLILICINHGDAILSGEVNSNRLIKMGITFLVPYIVSTISIVGTIIEDEVEF